MLIKILSDIHTEFGNKHLLPDFLSGYYDILIMAGDVADSSHIIGILLEIDKLAKTTVVFVPGNHEYYGSKKSYIDKKLKETSFKNVVVLNNDIFTKDGVIFIGSTGWWDNGITLTHTNSMADFKLIHDIQFNDNGMLWGKESRLFFDANIKKSLDKRVVCISHNMPSRYCISPKFSNSTINECFANDWDYLLSNQAMWVCGHTHDSIDTDINGVRVLCNPYGYYHYMENINFNPNLIVEI